MADNVTVDNGDLTDYTVSADEGAGGQVQRVKLAYSADGEETHVPADADGVLVNLGANNDVTVTGNVAVTNAGLTELAAAIDTEMQVDVVGALPAGNNNIGDVDVASSALPSGASTSAKQDTMIGHLDGVEGILTTIDGDTGTLAGAVAGTEMQVDVVGALPVGTNNIGDVDIASIAAGDNNIGNVDVVTLPALPAGSNNIGDVDVASSVLPTGASTLAEQQTQTASLSVLDDWDESDRAKVNSIAGQAGVQGGSGAVSASTQRVVLATDVALPAGTNNIGDVDVLTLPGVAGAAAHASPTSGNPIYVAGRASAAIPTDVGADGDAAGMWTNRNGATVVLMAPHVGLNGDPWSLVHETAQYTTTQTSTVLVAGGASEKIVVTKVQIQVGGTTAGSLQLYFGTGAYSRGTSRAIFDGEFAPSATLKPGVIMDGPFIAGTNGDDLMVTDSAAINPLTITCWYYVVV